MKIKGNVSKSCGPRFRQCTSQVALWSLCQELMMTLGNYSKSKRKCIVFSISNIMVNKMEYVTENKKVIKYMILQI